MKRNYFGSLTKRMEEFREELLETKPYVCAERAVYTTEAYKKHADEPVTLKRAYMLKNILENMSIFIEPQTLIVGNQASGNRFAPIFPEYAMDWVINELDKFDKRDGDVFYIKEETKEVLKEISP
ncbi:MAG: pyruvate formate lyase family protein, partial [Clostridium cadaveris]|nr:pyruvate formate lyase family protein [Clostridium cadaveris]